jgi:hypothetical protein
MPQACVTRPAALRSAALAMLMCTVWAADARAGQDSAPDTSEPIGVLEVATYGVSQAAGEKFEQSVEETLAGVGFRVVRSRQVQQELAGTNYVSGCTFGPCMKEVLTRTGLRRVLVARIQGAGQSYSVVVSLIDTETGYLVSQVAQSCPVCTVEDAISTSIKAVVELLTDEDASGAAGDGPRAVAALRPREPDDAVARLARRRQQARRLGWVFVASGAAAVGLAAGLVAADRDDAAFVSGGLGGGLVAAGLTALVWSRSF